MVNEDQKKAINIIDGPVLVLAGPGSGKTFVTINRIYNMVINENIDPNNILVITFTNKASKEMKERYKILAESNNIDIEIPKFGTFHSIFYEILRKNFGYNENSLIKEKEKFQYLVEVLEKYDDINIDNTLIKNILSDITEEKIKKEKNEKFYPRFLTFEKYEKVRNDYKNKLYNEKKLDFYDMINLCFELLSKHNDVLTYYQNKYKYILIDEFQDINKDQYDIIKLICKTKNLFVVGDDDQSIYMFRGSKPSIIKDFKNDYKKCKIINLNQNYRCAKNIVNFSKKIIDKNKNRVRKELRSERDCFGKVSIKTFDNSLNENQYILEYIKRNVNNGISYKDIAILYRTNILSRSIIDKLKSQNIPFEVRDTNNLFFDISEVKDILSYLRISIGMTDSSDFIRIANKPLRYISRESISYKHTSLDQILKYYSKNNFILKNVIKFKYDMCKISKMHPAIAIQYIRKDIGYEKYVIENANYNNKNIYEIKMVLDTLEEMTIGTNNIKEFIYKIDNDIKKELSNSNENNNDDNKVKLMTFHSSKGLEFSNVLIIDANDGLIPHKKSIDNMDLETERRLFYVACTRAKNDLCICFTKERFGKIFKPSRFIIEAVRR